MFMTHAISIVRAVALRWSSGESRGCDPRMVTAYRAKHDRDNDQSRRENLGEQLAREQQVVDRDEQQQQKPETGENRQEPAPRMNESAVRRKRALEATWR